MSNKSRFRNFAVRVVENKNFDNLILYLILINVFVLAAKDY